MDPLPYQRAFERIRAEYLDMPGMRLTPTQVQRLSGVDNSVCRLVLDDLVRAKFLWIGPDGSYLRFRYRDSFGLGPMKASHDSLGV